MPGLLSREVESGVLRAAVADVVAGRGSVVLIDGEAGIGKSALADAAVEMASAAEVEVFRCWGDELSSDFPLVPLFEAFGVRGSSSDARRAEIGRVLRGRYAGGDRGVEVAAEELLLGLIDELCAAGPVLLVVDDLQWVDESTVRVLHRLARTVAQRSLLLVGLMRPLPRRDDLLALHRVVGLGAVLRLAPLSDGAVRELVAGLAGGVPGPELLGLVDAAAGNPLYVRELVAALDRAGRLAVTGDVVGVDGVVSLASLAEVIADRLEFLPVSAREVVRAAALLGVDFTAGDVAAVLGRGVSELLPVFDDAYHSGVLVESGHDGGVLAFRHPLIRAALYEKTPRSVRNGLHRDAAQALDRAGAPVTAVARQLSAAGRSLRLDEWLYDWLVASVQTLVNTAPLVAVSLLEPLLPETPRDDVRRETLVCALADAWFRLDRHADVARLARANVETIADPHLQAGLYDTLAGSVFDSVVLKQMGDELRSVPVDADPVRQARLTVIAARAYLRARELESAMATADKALTIAEKIGDSWVAALALNTLGVGNALRGGIVEALELFERGLAATADDPTLTDQRLQLLSNRAGALSELDRPQETLSVQSQARILAERIGNRSRVTLLQSCIVDELYVGGRWDEALAEADLSDDGETRNPATACLIHGTALMIAIHRDDAGLTAQHLAAGAAHAKLVDAAFLNQWVPAMALGRERAGEPGEALAILLDQIRHMAVAEESPSHVERLLSYAVRLAVLVGDGETAEAMTLRVEELANASSVLRDHGAVWHCRGLVAGDPALLSRAARRYEERGRPLSRAQALEAAAVLLAGRGEVDAGRQHGTAAVDIYAGLGASWDITRLRSVLRASGIRTRSRTGQARATTGWAALTPTENQVVDLLAQGMSNPQIADRLMLSRRTVETYVSSVLRKLDLRSRVDIALAAAKRTQPEDDAPHQRRSPARGA